MSTPKKPERALPRPTSPGEHTAGDTLSAASSDSAPAPAPPGPPPAESADTLGGYRLLRSLGAGGMGVVYLAEDQALKRQVAIKVMKPELAANPQAKARFQREARAAAAVEHEHVVAIHHIGEEGGVPFLVMPLLRGEPLDARLKREGKLPPGEVIRVGREMAEGLAAAHATGLVHRDVKPANVWLEGERGRVRILDFGLARPRDGGGDAGITASGVMLGTPAYMAPEQAEGSAVDARADLFSLGCVLYQMATGRRPFPGNTAMAILTSLATHTPPPAAAVNPEVPPPLSDLIARLLEKDPARRPPSARVVAEALENVERDLTVPVALPLPAAAPAPAAEAGPDPWAGLEEDDTEAPPTEAAPKPSAKPAAKRGVPRWWAAGLALLGVAVVAGAVVLFLKVRGGRTTGPTSPEVADPTGKGDRPTTTAEWERQRQAEAEAAFPALEAKFRAPNVAFESFAREVRGFRAKHGGTPAAVRAAGLLTKLPSPPDALDPARVPPDVKATWKLAGFDGRDVVAVLGGQRWRVNNGWAEGFVLGRGGRRLFAFGSPPFDTATGLMTGEPPVGESWLSAGGRWLSPDGRLAAGAVWGEKVVHVREVASGKEVARLEGHTAQVWSVAFTPDGKTLVTGGADGVRLWDTETWKERGTLPTKLIWSPYGLAMPRTGTALAFLAEDAVVLWDLGAGKETASFRREHVQSVALSPDGTLLAAGAEDGRVVVWDVKGRREVAILAGLGGSASRLTFSPDGKLLAAGNYNAGQRELPAAVIVWDAATWKERVRLPHFDQINDLAFSPDGKQLYTIGWNHGVVRLWDTETGKEDPPAGHLAAVKALAFTPDGGSLLTGGLDGTMRQWDLRTGKERRQFEGAADYFAGLHFSPDGRRVLTCGHPPGAAAAVRLWNFADGHPVQSFAGHTARVGKVFFLGDGSKAVSAGSDAIRVWDVAGGQELRGIATPASAFAVAPNGRHALSGGDDGLLRLWDLEKGTQLHSLDANQGHVRDLAYFPDGGRAVSGGDSSQVRLWEVAGLRLRPAGTFAGLSAGAWGVAVGPDGSRVAAGSDAGEVCVWDAATQRLLGYWRFPGWVTAVAFAPDGRHLAVGNGNGLVFILRLPAEPRPPGRGDFVALFNGKDLSGWKAHPGAKLDWAVEGGVLKNLGRTAPAYLFSERGDYRDFHLRAEVRLAAGDAGIFLRAPFAPQLFGPGIGLVYEAGIDSPGTLVRAGNNQILANWPYRSPLPTNRWFTLEVIAEGARLVVKIDGQTVADVTDPEPHLAPGHIALQKFTANTAVEFRAIAVKGLAPAPKAK